MKCANAQCGRMADDIFTGTLRLVERKVPANGRLAGDEDGFPVCSVPSRYFWLCSECSASMEVRAWTGSQIVLGPRRHVRRQAEAEASTDEPVREAARRRKTDPPIMAAHGQER